MVQGAVHIRLEIVYGGGGSPSGPEAVEISLKPAVDTPKGVPCHTDVAARQLVNQKLSRRNSDAQSLLNSALLPIHRYKK